MHIPDFSDHLTCFRPLFERYPSAPFFFRDYRNHSFCLAADIDPDLLFSPSLEFAVEQGYDRRYKEVEGSPCSGARRRAAEILLRDFEAWRGQPFQPYARVMTRPSMRWVSAVFEKREITSCESYEGQWLEAAGEESPNRVRYVHSRRDLLFRRHDAVEGEKGFRWKIFDASALPATNAHLRAREEILRQLTWTRWMVG